MLVITAMWRNFLRERFSYMKEILKSRQFLREGDLGESFKEGFYVFGVVRHEFISKESATGFGDE